MLKGLKNFHLRKWLHPVFAVGLALVVVGLAVKNHDIALFGLGVIACGFGEQTLEGYSRFNRPIGFALVGLGVLLIGVGLYRLVGL